MARRWLEHSHFIGLLDCCGAPDDGVHECIRASTVPLNLLEGASDDEEVKVLSDENDE